MSIRCEGGEETSLRWLFYTWIMLQDLAQAYGWTPLGTQAPPEWIPTEDQPTWHGNYYANSGQTVLAEDARALGEALTRALPDLPDEWAAPDEALMIFERGEAPPREVLMEYDDGTLTGIRSIPQEIADTEGVGDLYEYRPTPDTMIQLVVVAFDDEEIYALKEDATLTAWEALSGPYRTQVQAFIQLCLAGGFRVW